MNSAYTNLEQSLAAKEWGAKQDQWPQMVWVNVFATVPSTWVLRWVDAPTTLDPKLCVAALPWLTDDPQGSGEQSALGLLESLGWEWRATRNHKWQATHSSLCDKYPFGTYIPMEADSPGALFMACYQRWKDVVITDPPERGRPIVLVDGFDEQ